MAVNPEKYHTGDGSKTSFDLDFEYIDETDVKVSVDGTVRPTTEYSFANATTILFDTAPDADTEIRIYRDTNVDELKSTFFAGSSIRAQDLNQNFEQNNFAVQEIKAYTWDNETQTIHSDETWVSSDAQIATTAAMDQRFQDEAQDTLTKAELAALSDVIPDNDDAVPTTGAVKDYVDHVIETDILVDGTGLNKTGSSGQVTIGISAGSVDLDRIKPADIVDSTEAWSATDTQVATTQAIEDRIDEIITNDIGTDGTGITVTDDGDGTITLGLANNSIDLARIKNADIITSGESDPDNDITIATTAKIGDMIDVAIANDITSDGSGVTVTDDGDGTITLSVEEGALNLNRINAGNIVTESEQDGGAAENDTTIFTTLAAAKRFDTLVQTANPGLVGNWETGKTWLQNDDDLTLSVWNGTGWVAITSGGTFTSQPNVVYVDKASGDDNNNGHRISTPKSSITSAIDQINGEISLSTDTDEGFNGGSGYVDGDYTNVSLTHSSGTGIGTGLTASITVASGAVTAITLSAAQQTALEEYSIGDVLTASNADLGGSGSGLLIPITGAGDGQIVVVSAGVYQEAAPIQIKRRNVSIIGQALRSCIVHPTVATQGDQSDGNHALFELNSGSYIANLTLTGMQANAAGSNTLDDVLPSRQGWNFAFYEDAFIVKSPYIQNCTNFSDSEIDNSDLRAHRPRGGAAGDTDSAPTGGGMLINGATPADDSPLRSMVADSYTHVGLNGPGVLVVNNGYAQITSSYAFFNRYHIKCLNGGQANLAASTTDFGDQALVADGRSTNAIFTSTTIADAADQATEFFIGGPNARTATPLPWHGTDVRPQSNMLVDIGGNTYPILSSSNTFDADEIISGLDYTILTVGDTDFTAIGAASNTVGQFFTATGTGSGSGTVTAHTAWRVSISRPNPNNRGENLGLDGAVLSGGDVDFFLRSQVASSGHTMEYVGSGTNYNALPENGGVPVEANQITELNNGKVWTAITDHNGKFKIGGNQTEDPIFEVDQQLGFVTIPEGSIAFNLVSDLTPQLGGDLDVNGNTITGLANPSANDEAANKAYVDSVAGTPTRIAQLNTSVEATDTGTDGTITFTTDGTTAMTVDNSGRVKIGNDTDYSAASGSKLAVELMTTAGTILEIADQTSGFSTFESVKNAGGTATDYGGYIFRGRRDADDDIKEYLRINSSGNVGIGTSPSVPLQVQGSAGEIRIQRPTAAQSDWSMKLPSSSGEYQIFDNNNSTARLTIDSSGRVGIGTSSPSSPLNVRGADEVEGDAHGTLILEDTAAYNANPIAGVIFRGHHASNNAKAYFSSVYGGKENATDGNYSGYLAFATRVSGSTAAERMRITSAGNVGIGVTSPSSTLHIATTPANASSPVAIRVGNNGSGSGTGASISLGAGGGAVSTAGNIAGFYDGTGTALSFSTSDNYGVNAFTERARIDSSGRFGIGTTSPSSFVDIRGNNPAIEFDHTGTNAQRTFLQNNDGTLRIRQDPDNSGSSSAITFEVDASEKFRMASNGAFGIGGANYGTSGQVLTSQGSGSAPQWADAAGGLFDAYALLRDVKPNNTSGGSFTSGAWRVRDLNEETHDPSGIVSLSSNQFTLGAGTYYIIWRTPSFGAQRTVSRVLNVTDSSTVAVSDATYSVTTGGYSQQSNEGRVRVTITASKAFRIEHRSEANGSFGLNTTVGENQIFTQVEIFREA